MGLGVNRALLNAGKSELALQAAGGVYADAAILAGSSWNLTDTSFDTPGSCMVTPYMTGAMPMVFLLWVMMMNWVWPLISRTRSANRPMFASSNGASTSSRMQNGLG